MRRMGAFLLAMALVWAAPAWSSSGEGKGAPAAKKDSAAAAAKPKSAAKSAEPANAELASELAQLQEMIQEQSRQIKAQQKQIESLQHQIALRAPVPATSVPAPIPTALTATPAATASAAPPAAAEASAAATVSTSPASGNSAEAVKLPSSAAAGAQAKPELGPLAFDKIKLGVTFYGDYTFYNQTGFGPQFVTQANQEGPGNDNFSSFDITRTYLNFVYTPNDHVTLRVTPNIYRQVDGSSGSIANGNGAEIGGSTNGNLTFRLKYAYVDFNKLFGGAFAKDKLTFGQTQEPLVDWEEGLYGYRFTSLVPWNYLSLSSTYVGAKIHGPIMSNGKEILDYDLGVFNTTSFHHIEQSANKEVMGRLTWYPVGTTKDRTGFGITLFEDYGYSNKTPDTRSVPVNRFSAFAFYQTLSKSALIAFEYDMGRNALSTGNLFSGARPVSGGLYDVLATTASSILSGDRTTQRGYDVFGHVKLGSSRFALFGLFMYYQPNTNFDYSAANYTANPIDFARTVGGISYSVNQHFEFALGDENFHWVHPQGLFGTKDTNGIAIWTQFNY